MQYFLTRLNTVSSKLDPFCWRFIFRPRFGLFSQPVSVAIGDTNKFPSKTANKDEDGRPILGPRNFYTKREKRGKDDSVYFSIQSYLCIGDLYR